MANFFSITIGLMLVTILFQLITLPVEYDASNKARAQLEQLSIIYDNESLEVKEMLNSAALTYVASLLVAILNIIRLIMIFNDHD